jgi:hypothetical protein
MTDRPVIRVGAVAVSFRHRDARYVSEEERRYLEDLVRSEQDAEGPGRVIEEIVIDTDYVDGRGVRFRSTVRVDPAAEGEDTVAW